MLTMHKHVAFVVSILRKFQSNPAYNIGLQRKCYGISSNDYAYIWEEWCSWDKGFAYADFKRGAFMNSTPTYVFMFVGGIISKNNVPRTTAMLSKMQAQFILFIKRGSSAMQLNMSIMRLKEVGFKSYTALYSKNNKSSLRSMVVKIWIQILGM